MTINQVVIVGRLSRDPEIRNTQNGTKVATFTIAVDRYMGEGKEAETDFIPVVAWNGTAEFVDKYFFKGKKIIVQGNLRQRSWEDNDGRKHYVVEVWAEKVDFADDKKKEDGNNRPSQQETPSTTPPQQNTPLWQQGQPQTPPAASTAPDNRPPWMR